MVGSCVLINLVLNWYWICWHLQRIYSCIWFTVSSCYHLKICFELHCKCIHYLIYELMRTLNDLIWTARAEHPNDINLQRLIIKDNCLSNRVVIDWSFPLSGILDVYSMKVEVLKQTIRMPNKNVSIYTALISPTPLTTIITDTIFFQIPYLSFQTSS